MSESVIANFKDAKRAQGLKAVEIKISHTSKNISGGALHHISWKNSRRWAGRTTKVPQPEEYVYEKGGTYKVFKELKDLLDHLTHSGGSGWSRLTLYDTAKICLFGLSAAAVLLFMLGLYLDVFHQRQTMQSILPFSLGILGIFAAAAGGLFAGRKSQ